MQLKKIRQSQIDQISKISKQKQPWAEKRADLYKLKKKYNIYKKFIK